jgi:hypothetical protein
MRLNYSLILYFLILIIKFMYFILRYFITFIIFMLYRNYHPDLKYWLDALEVF